MFAPGVAPRKSLGGQLEFALKWEGVSLSVLRALFRRIEAAEVVAIVRAKPTGAYSRRIWFLYEWLMEARLDLPDCGKVKAVPVVNPRLQFAPESGPLSRRHRVRDNLPGTRQFCPMVRRTSPLDSFVDRRLEAEARRVMGRTHSDIVRRAAAFLLLEDSKASFQIEGERPPPSRQLRWGQAIAEAGRNDPGVDELARLQKIVICDDSS